MIHKCIALFNLIPTTPNYHWLIAADWLEEENKYTEANAFRENLPFLIDAKNSKGIDFRSGDSNRYADGFGNVNGKSNSWGFGDGTGSGYNYGDGKGDGSGFGDGNGHGHERCRSSGNL